MIQARSTIPNIPTYLTQPTYYIANADNNDPNRVAQLPCGQGTKACPKALHWKGSAEWMNKMLIGMDMYSYLDKTPT